MNSDWKRIRLVVFDFDGVFTDNRVIVSETGEESVICHRGDGLGLARLKTAPSGPRRLSYSPTPRKATSCSSPAARTHSTLAT